LRWFDYLALTAIIVAATAQFLTGSDGAAPPSETPRRPAPQQFAEQQDDMSGNTETEPRLPPPSVPQNSVPDLGQGVVEEKSARTTSTGSAFPILSDGTWLTARHVAQDCKKISLRLGNHAVPVSRRVLHPFADIAILKTKAAVTPFPFASGSAPLGTAYHIGFPKGRPGVVASGFLGEMTLWHKGRHNYRERVHVWAERVRYPQRQGSLGGLSGGAVLDPEGRIIGVTQAESPRRGRIMTGMPERVSEIAGFAAITLPAAGGASTPIAPEKFGETGFALINGYRIAKVLCRV
jgi:S1-C subfamily serine protease